MAANRKMVARMVPDKLVLTRVAPRKMHDIGELVVYQNAKGTVTATIFVEDAETGKPLDAVVHLNNRIVKANEPFQYEFVSELDEIAELWSIEKIWAEHPGYDSVVVTYSVEVN